MRKLTTLVAASAVTALLGLALAVVPVSAAAEIAPCQDGTTNLPAGLQTDPYINPAPTEDRSFDGPTSTFAVDSPTSPQDEGITIGEDVLRNRICVGRANVKNLVDPDYQRSWDYWHDQIGGHGIQVYSKNINIGDMYIHGGEDSIKLQNCQEGNPPVGSDDCNVQQPGGQFHIADVALRNQHDDAIDDDDCMPGTISNVLIEGHTGLSVQEENSSSGPCQSDGEGNISITNSIIRTMPVSKFTPADGDQFPGGGKWLKFQDNNNVEDHHTVTLQNVTLVVDRRPRSDWGSLDLPGANGTPGDVNWVGPNNFILYLNTAGEPYGGPVPGTQGIPNSGPNAVTFQTGSQAKQTFTTKRDNWLDAHGCQTEGPNDIDPKDSPMCRIKTGSK
jgi:hypothetical protein